MISIKRLLKKESTSEYCKIEAHAGCCQIVRLGIVGEEDASTTIDSFDSEEELNSSVEMLIKEKLKDGFVEEVDSEQAALLKRIEKADVREDWFWHEVENDLYDCLKQTLATIESQDVRYSHLRFWFHVEYPQFYIYCENDKEIAELDIPILWGIYSKYEPGMGEYLPISREELGKRLFKHCSYAIKKLNSEKCFDGIANQTLSVSFDTVDDWFGEVIQVNL